MIDWLLENVSWLKSREQVMVVLSVFVAAGLVFSFFMFRSAVSSPTEAPEGYGGDLPRTGDYFDVY